MPIGVLAIDPLLPPTSLALLALLSLLLRRRGGRTAAIVLLAVLLLLSLPIVSVPLLAALDPAETGDPGLGGAPGAIVILSADVVRAAAPGPVEVGPMTLERERAGAALQRRTGLPVLVTGGIVGPPPAVGVLMAASMPADFGVPVRWAEVQSATTWENARLSVPMLRAAGVERVYLVTHGWHMRRSLLAFRRAGMDAVPAVVRRDPGPRWLPGEFIPQTYSWERSFLALHEWVGLLFYMARP